MNKIIALMLAGALALPLAACQTKQQTGALFGGAIGGLLGSQFGEGQGKVGAAVAGTILGAALGSEVGKSMDATDELKAEKALETSVTGQPTTWVNPDSGSQVTVTPTRTYYVDENVSPTGEIAPCREFTTEVMVGGQKQDAYGTACRQADGSWKIVQ